MTGREEQLAAIDPSCLVGKSRREKKIRKKEVIVFGKEKENFVEAVIQWKFIFTGNQMKFLNQRRRGAKIVLSHFVSKTLY